MTIIETKDPDVSLFLLPWLIEDDDSRIHMGAWLYEKLINDPDNTYVSVITDGPNVVGTILAYTDCGRVHLWQAHISPQLRDTQPIMDKLIEWTKGRGYDRIFCKSYRGRALMRKWGFEHVTGDIFAKEI